MLDATHCLGSFPLVVVAKISYPTVVAAALLSLAGFVGDGPALPAWSLLPAAWMRWKGKG